MNSAEHIRAQVRWLAEEDRITRMQLVEIVEELLAPFVPRGGDQSARLREPRHFDEVNMKIHRLRAVSDPPIADEDDL
jgi:hypothetical protein